MGLGFFDRPIKDCPTEHVFLRFYEHPRCSIPKADHAYTYRGTRISSCKTCKVVRCYQALKMHTEKLSIYCRIRCWGMHYAKKGSIGVIKKYWLRRGRSTQEN